MMLEIEKQSQVLIARSDVAPAIEGAQRTSREIQVRLNLLGGFSRNHVDDPADGVAPEQGGCRAFNHFDTIQPGC